MYNQHPSHQINSPRSIGCFIILFILGMITSFRKSTGNKIKIDPTLSFSLPTHNNNFWKPHRCVLNVLIALRKWFHLISNFNHSPAVVTHLKCSQELGHCHHQHQYLGTGYLSSHRKWGSISASNVNMVNQSQHHQPCVIPPYGIWKTESTSYYSSYS